MRRILIGFVAITMVAVVSARLHRNHASKMFLSAAEKQSLRDAPAEPNGRLPAVDNLPEGFGKAPDTRSVRATASVANTDDYLGVYAARYDGITGFLDISNVHTPVECDANGPSAIPVRLRAFNKTTPIVMGICFDHPNAEGILQSKFAGDCTFQIHLRRDQKSNRPFASITTQGDCNLNKWFPTGTADLTPLDNIDFEKVL